jgi:4-diphosphocytidyl-2-C-methyl-D-erythritol kinase
VEIEFYPAPAKLNLFLHVLGRREEGEYAGYHELQTVFRLIDRSDRVGIAPRDDGQIRFSGDFGEDNLCVTAARLLKAETGSRRGCDLSLEKNIPVGGGLGGGSSDAATVLLVLNRRWGLNLNRNQLIALAARLGADVPVFVFGRNALGEGIGERLEALELPPAWYLVLTPQVSVSTKEIFGGALTCEGKRLKIPPFFPGQGKNDLEPVVTARYPEVAAQLAWLRSRCPQARMTGSGAGVFSEVETESEARSLQSQMPDTMRGFVARGLEQHPLCDWAY